jgi:hypothetical protein
MTKIPKESQTEPTTAQAWHKEAAIERVIRERLSKVPFVRLHSIRREVPIDPGGDSVRVDYAAKLSVHERPVTLVVEWKNEVYPKGVRDAASQLRHYISNLHEKQKDEKRGYGILAAPFISEASAKICADEGIGYIDLAGNALLRFESIFIERRVTDKNPYRRQEFYSLFSARATRILRILMNGPIRPWKVEELAQSANVSVGWVSEVRKQLIAQDWATADENGLRVTRPNSLLDAWAKQDHWRRRTEVRQYSTLLADPAEVALKVRDLLKEGAFGDGGFIRHAFTQSFAGWLRRPYTVPITVSAYVDRFPDEEKFMKTLLARRVDGGAQLLLVKPRDAGVFVPLQIVSGFTLVCDVQIYLDLLHAGQRADEQAHELRKSADFSGGWS